MAAPHERHLRAHYMRSKFLQLKRVPNHQALAIAEHYLSCAQLALQLRQAVWMLNRAGAEYDTRNLTEYVAKMQADIQEEHAKSFGIELRWDLEPEEMLAREKHHEDARADLCIVMAKLDEIQRATLEPPNHGPGIY